MPGIFGLIDKKSGVQNNDDFSFAAALKTMAEVMRYEPWYVSMTYDYRELGVYLGNVGHSNREPLEDQQKGLSLFLSDWGNADAEESEQGFKVFSHYEQAEDKFPDIMSGLCSGVLVDEKHHKCLLFNDRFGVERLFLYEDNNKSVFASEAKAILAVIPETRDFDPVGLGEFLASGCTLGENSLFRNIRVLPPGTMIKFTMGRPPQTSKYLDYSTLERLEPLQEEGYFLEELCKKLKALVKMYSQPPGQAAISLTGGLDSRMIMACLAPDSSIPCYTFGSMFRETYDVLIARKVARHCGQTHQTIVLGEDFLKGFQNFLSRAVFVSDGYLGFSGAAELYLNSLARTIAPLRITGNYGGELLRGIRAFKSSVPKGEFLRPELVASVKEATRVFSQMRTMHPTSFTLFFQAPAGYGRYAIERSQVSLMSPFLQKNIVELIYRRPLKYRSGTDPSLAVLKACAQALLSIPTDRGLLGADSVITRTARRYFREAIFKLEYWTGQGMPDSVSWASNFSKGFAVKRLFTGRHKFQHFPIWTRNQLSNFIRTVLEKDRNTNLGRYIDFKYVKDMSNEHQAGKKNFTNEIDKLVTLVLVDELLLRNRQIAK